MEEASAFSLWSLLSSIQQFSLCSPSVAEQSAKTRNDHDALAKHYEDAAKDMGLKAEEHKKMLAQ